MLGWDLLSLLFKTTNNMTKITNIRRTQEEVMNWYQEHLNGATLQELNIKYLTDCKYQFNKLKLVVKKTSYLRRTNKQNICYYFESINNDFEAYVLGLIFADGSISNNSLKIGLLSEDICLLEQIRDYIIPTQKLHEDRNNMSLVINSKLITQNLMRCGITNTKTYDDFKIPKEIPNHLISSFIRGYFDGDGTVYYDKKYLRFSICSITTSILLDIQNHFILNGIESSINTENRQNKIYKVPQGTSSNCKDMCRIYVRKQKSLDLLFSYLYTNSTIHLNRKYDKFKSYVNTEISQ